MMTGMRVFAGCLAAMTVLAIGPAGAARAAEPTEPKVEYSADSVIETEGTTVTSKVFHAAGKERMEMDLHDAKQVMIMRRDKDVAWSLMPEQKMYMEMSLKEGKKKSRDVRDCKVAQTASGSEVVNGFRTTRSKIDMSCPDGSRYSGTMWVTGDGIAIKMEAVAKGSGPGTKGRIRSELKNLKIGRQDPALFEVPSGYRKFSLGGAMPAMGGTPPKGKRESSGARPQADAPADEQEQPSRLSPPDEEGSPDTTTDRLKKLKGLFKW